jgi:hypothetical protein
MVSESQNLLTYKIPIEDLSVLISCVDKDNWDNYKREINNIIHLLKCACNNKFIENKPFFEKRFITKIEKMGHYRPNGSCGTGYSEYDIIKVYFNNERSTILMLDTWYADDEKIWDDFKKNERLIGVVGLEENREKLLKEIHNYGTNK